MKRGRGRERGRHGGVGWDRGWSAAHPSKGCQGVEVSHVPRVMGTAAGTPPCSPSLLVLQSVLVSTTPAMCPATTATMEDKKKKRTKKKKKKKKRRMKFS